MSLSTTSFYIFADDNEHTITVAAINARNCRKDWQWFPKDAFASCPGKRCRMVGNMNESDAVLVNFHFLWRDCDLPIRTNVHQKWIMITRESQRLQIMPQFLDLFNATASYMSISEVESKFGEIIPRKTQAPRSYHDEHWLEKKNIAWMVSNCKAKRMVYVKELEKHIDVTKFGSCGERCPSGSCMKFLNKSFRFYLAFENSVCEDYVTEKLYRTLTSDMIPIVYGHYDYKTKLPRNSVIDVRDFNSPKQLAEYLQQIANNKTLFDSYFQWKELYEVTEYSYNTYYTGMACSLCQYLHETKYDPPKTVDLRHFNSKEHCIPDEEFNASIGVKKKDKKKS